MKGKDICFICRAGSPSTCHPALLWKYVVDITLVVDKINHVVYQIYNIAKKIIMSSMKLTILSINVRTDRGATWLCVIWCSSLNCLNVLPAEPSQGRSKSRKKEVKKGAKTVKHSVCCPTLIVKIAIQHINGEKKPFIMVLEKVYCFVFARMER